MYNNKKTIIFIDIFYIIYNNNLQIITHFYNLLLYY